MNKGTVTSWMCDRGYGFIETKKGNERLFVHQSNLMGIAYLQEGEKVEFNIEETKRGPKAINVKPIFLSAF
jgi:CspA family cold shock protein